MQAGPTPGQRTELGQHSLLLGRDPEADFVIDDVEVSRRHARLTAENGGYTIEDLGSTNGTFVNDERIQGAVALQNGDSFRLGDRITFVYEAISADEAMTQGFSTKPPSTEPAHPASHAAEEPAAVLPPISRPPAQKRQAAAAVEQPALSEEAVMVEEPAGAAPTPRRRERRKGLRLPIFNQPWVTILSILILLGACGSIFFLWYVDANYLWCDVFGSLIPACR